MVDRQKGTDQGAISPASLFPPDPLDTSTQAKAKAGKSTPGGAGPLHTRGPVTFCRSFTELWSLVTTCTWSSAPHLWEEGGTAARPGVLEQAQEDQVGDRGGGSSGWAWPTPPVFPRMQTAQLRAQAWGWRQKETDVLEQRGQSLLTLVAPLHPLQHTLPSQEEQVGLILLSLLGAQDLDDLR